MRLALVPTPGLSLSLVRHVAKRVPALLDGSDVEVEVVEDAMDGRRGDVEELLGGAASLRERSGTDVAICLTEVPLRTGVQPLAAAVDLEGNAGVVSVPAFGASRLRPRAVEATAALVSEFTSEARSESVARPLVRQRIGELLSPIRPAEAEEGSGRVYYVLPVALGHLRLLTGMVRANRPWRALSGLSRAVVAAFATGAYALLTVSIWEVSNALESVRLIGIMVASLVALIAWIVIAHEMWESVRGEMAVKDAALYNAATVLTLFVAALCAYVALFALLLLVAALVVQGGVYQKNVGHAADLAAYAKLAWIGASMATVAGALGSGLEDVDEVREAAYGANQQQRDQRGDPG